VHTKKHCKTDMAIMRGLPLPLALLFLQLAAADTPDGTVSYIKDGEIVTEGQRVIACAENHRKLS
jgi:hypothetical protein